MTTKKTTDEPNTGKATRAAKSLDLTREPAGPEVMAMSARLLKHYVDGVVAELDRHVGEGMSEAEAMIQITSDRTEINHRAAKVQQHSVIKAIREFAERNTLEQRRIIRALHLSSLAKGVASGHLEPEAAVDSAITARGDERLERVAALAGVKSAVASTRTTRRTWQEVYLVLAFDADVWPRPDTNRSLRGPLKRLYETDWGTVTGEG